MKKSRRKFSAKFKATVAIEAIKEQQTIVKLSNRFEIHPNQITTWKREFLENASAALGTEKKEIESTSEVSSATLYQEIGQLKVENEFLKKSLKRAGL